MPVRKNFRKRELESEDPTVAEGSDGEEDRRLALEEVKFLQKQRQRKSGIPSIPSPMGSAKGVAAVGLLSKRGGLVEKGGEGAAGDEKDELVLQDTFAQETAVMIEDPNMLKYVEGELAKKRGKNLEQGNSDENEMKGAEDELYKIPDHLKVKKRSSEESSTQWTTGIAEIQLPIEYKLRNIEETEAAKKLLQEKRLMGRSKPSELNIPASYSADYFQRGKDLADKLRKEHPPVYNDRSSHDGDIRSRQTADGGVEPAGSRQAATDEFMLERFRKRERHRVMRR